MPTTRIRATPTPTQKTRASALARTLDPVSAEEFIESIPFTETRNYVMTILASQEQYRRLYALKPGSSRTSAAR